MAKFKININSKETKQIITGENIFINENGEEKNVVFSYVPIGKTLEDNFKQELKDHIKKNQLSNAFSKLQEHLTNDGQSDDSMILLKRSLTDLEGRKLKGTIDAEKYDQQIATLADNFLKYIK